MKYVLSKFGGTLMQGDVLLGDGASTGRGMSGIGSVDAHVHLMGPGESLSGCRIARGLMASPYFSAMLANLGLRPSDASDARIRDGVLAAIETSRKVDYAVLLAADAVYRNGRRLEGESLFVVPNEYVSGIARRHERVLFGASVHPYREGREMLAETKRCIDEGAVLFKWAPSVQRIDPEDERCIPFYLQLARAGVPLMCNINASFDPVLNRGSRFDDPMRLVTALDIGVKVILSHHVFSSHEERRAGRRNPARLAEMAQLAGIRKWELYFDMTSTIPSWSYPAERLSDTIYWPISGNRLLYGSDFPMGAAPDQDSGNMDDEGLRNHNLLDQAYEMSLRSGGDESVFSNAWDVLRISPGAAS